MASGLAGAKAGLRGGLFFAALVGAFNVTLLETFKGSVMASLQASTACTTAPTTPQECFSALTSIDVLLLVVLPVAVTGILLGTLYGMYYETIPGQGYRTKAVAIAMAMLVVLLFFHAWGIVSDVTQGAIMLAFDVVALAAYVLIIARFYRRYTREVRFESAGEKRKVMVDNKDFTGKTKTLSIHSSHKVKAPSENGAFHGWLVSGGVSVLDPKSPETTLKVDGDGLLKLS